MYDFGQPLNVINNCFRLFGDRLEEFVPGCTNVWNGIKLGVCQNYLDITGDGVYTYDANITPENYNLVFNAINDFDVFINDDPDGIARKTDPNIRSIWKTVKDALQEFAVSNMNPEDAYMYSTRIMGKNEGESIY